MATKLDLLRSGEAVEVKPGLSARLNREKKTLQLSTGEYFDVGDNPRYFPRSDQELNQLRHREAVESEVSKSPFGEFGHQFATQGLVGGGRDWISYLTRKGDDYLARKKAEQEVSQRISKESPFTSAASTVASFVPDAILTRGMSAAKAVPLLVAGSSGSRLISEPLEVAKEAAIGSVAGFGLDKSMNYLSRIAQRRGAARALPEQQRVVQEANQAGERATKEFNALQKQQHAIEKQDVKNINERRLQEHDLTMNERQNKIIEETNDFNRRMYDREVKVQEMKHQAELAKSQGAADYIEKDNLYKTEKANIDALNEKELFEWKAEIQRLKNENNNSIQNYNKLLNDRKNEIISNTNSDNLKKVARDAKINELKNEAEKLERLGKSEYIEKTNEYNLAIAAAKEEDRIAKHRHLVEKNEIDNMNRELLGLHENDLNSRKNIMINAKNEQLKKSYENDVLLNKLKNEADLAKSQGKFDAIEKENHYKETKEYIDKYNKLLDEEFLQLEVEYKNALKNIPEIQKKAQEEYAKEVVYNAKNIEKAFPATSKIPVEYFKIDEFIDEYIHKAGLYGSKEGNQVSKILNGIFQKNELIDGRKIAKKYKAVENAIGNGSPQVKSLLLDFKKHLGQNLPTALADSVAYVNIMPVLKRTLGGDVNSILEQILKNEKPKVREKVIREALGRLSDALKRDIKIVDFYSKLKNGDLPKEIISNLLTVEDMIPELTDSSIKYLKKTGNYPLVLLEAKNKYQNFITKVSNKLNSRLAVHELKAKDLAEKASQNLKDKIGLTYGMAESVERPLAPSRPSYGEYPARPPKESLHIPIERPSPIPPPEAPLLPEKPSLYQYPAPPSPAERPLPPSKVGPTPGIEMPPPVGSTPIPLLPDKPVMSQYPSMPTPQPYPAPPARPLPVAPIEIPPPVTRREMPYLPPRPALEPSPLPPTPQFFTPTPEPTMPPAQGLSDHLGDLLEKDFLGESKGIVDNPITKLAGLKYLLGGAALPLEAAYVGAKTLTSPTAVGEAARATFRMGGIQAIESWAKKYPSYRNGVLESPQDRRSLTKEIEDDSDIPLEQKAILQSKVNRGKPLNQSL